MSDIFIIDRSEKKITKNAAKCRLCGDVIESKSVHDFVVCSCGEIFVDGGHEYLRRGANNFENLIDKTQYADPNPNFKPTWQYFSKTQEEWINCKSTDDKIQLLNCGYQIKAIS